jgi:hypothetical protein
MSTTQDARKKFTIATAQVNLYSKSLGSVIGKVDTSKMGTVYNPFTSQPAVSEGAVSSTHATSNYTSDADSLQINRRADASEHVNSYDWKSVDFGLLKDRAENMGSSISQVVDAYFLNRPVGNATVALDAGDFNGTDGQAYGVTSTTIDDIINEGLTQIHLANSTDKKFAVVNPFDASAMRSFLQNTGNNVADNVIVNGITSGVTKVGTTFSGVDVFMSNNLTHEAVLALATNPTNGDTITINGVVITFLATMAGTAGSVHIASTVDITRANLAEFLTGTNFPGDTTEAEATDTGYTALSADNIGKLSRVSLTAVNDNGANTLTVTTLGTLTVGETLTDGTDAWGAVYHYALLGDYGSINLYLPSAGMDYTETKVAGKPGRELYMEQFHQSVVWTKMKDRIVTLKLKKG